MVATSSSWEGATTEGHDHNTQRADMTTAHARDAAETEHVITAATQGAKEEDLVYSRYRIGLLSKIWFPNFQSASDQYGEAT